MPDLSEQPDLGRVPRAARLGSPGWLDARLVAGVLLVLVSVVLGARLTASGDRSERVWSATHDLAAGSVLSVADLAPTRVRLFDRGDRYLLAAGAAPVGYVLGRGVGPGELVPRDSLVRPGQGGVARRDVSVPVAAGHLPDDLQAGQQVDVYVTVGRGTAGAPGPTAATTAGTGPDGTASPAGSASTAGTASMPGTAGTAGTAGTRLVLTGVAVVLRPHDAGLAASRDGAVVLSVPAADAVALVAAVQSGSVDLVRVPRADQVPALTPSGPGAIAAGPG